MMQPETSPCLGHVSSHLFKCQRECSTGLRSTDQMPGCACRENSEKSAAQVLHMKRWWKLKSHEVNAVESFNEPGHKQFLAKCTWAPGSAVKLRRGMKMAKNVFKYRCFCRWSTRPWWTQWRLPLPRLSPGPSPRVSHPRDVRLPWI